MEIELDFVFETLLLLTKKKYAARVVKDRVQQLDGTYTYRTEREVKGATIIRFLIQLQFRFSSRIVFQFFSTFYLPLTG